MKWYVNIVGVKYRIQEDDGFYVLSLVGLVEVKKKTELEEKLQTYLRAKTFKECEDYLFSVERNIREVEILKCMKK